MAHNFRKYLAAAGSIFVSQPAFTTGSAGNSVFISKAGNDANDGFTPDTPKLTYESAIATAKENMFFGRGVYIWKTSPGVSYAVDKNRYMYGDGEVTLDLGGYVIHTGQGFKAENITFRNVSKIYYNEYGGGTSGLDILRCEIVMTSNAAPNFLMPDTRKYKMSFTDCVLRNLVAADGIIQFANYTGCLLFGCRVESVYSLQRCWVSSDSYVMLNSQNAGTYTVGGIANNGTFNLAGIANNNNLRGQISLGPGLAYTNLATQIANSPTINAQSFNSDERFNNTFADDYTLKEDSPHLAPNIGPAQLRYSNSLYLNGPVADITATSSHAFIQASTGAAFPIIAATNLTASLQNSQLRAKVKEAIGGALDGSFDTAPIKVGDTSQEITYINFAAGNNSNTDYPSAENLLDPYSPQPLNNNVPDANNYTTGSAGRNPNRLTVLMRWSNKDVPNVATDADWITGAAFLLFEWKELAMYNPVSLLGNGNPGYLLASQTSAADAPRAPQAKFVQFRVVLTNGYFSK